MVLGTASGVGKSALVAAFCRILHRKGVRVAPFKAQNISLNSFVTPDGKEIGRSQALQARAAGIPPEGDMNPVLLKPESGRRMHVLLGGEPLGALGEEALRAAHGRFADQIRDSYGRLAARFEVIVMEGMGGAGEINLFERDLANFRAAEMADAAVILVGNIEAGGVFASLYGTWALCPPGWQSRISAFVINQLRGKAESLGGGPAALLERTGVPVASLVPHVEDFRLDAEDALDLDRLPAGPPPERDGRVRIAVIRLPHFANSTDIEPFLEDKGTHLFLARRADDVSGADAVILPGSKCVAADMAWMRENGLDRAVAAFAEKKGVVAGLCGGYQMLGLRVLDPHGVESPEREARGLGLLPVKTTLEGEKILRRVRLRARLPFFDGEAEGYEIHMGKSERAGSGASPAFFGPGSGGVSREEGAVSEDRRVFGTYLHGLFENDGLRNAFLGWVRDSAGLPEAASRRGPSFRERREAQLERWADVVERSFDLTPYIPNISAEATSMRLFSGSRKKI